MKEAFSDQSIKLNFWDIDLGCQVAEEDANQFKLLWC